MRAMTASTGIESTMLTRSGKPARTGLNQFRWDDAYSLKPYNQFLIPAKMLDIVNDNAPSAKCYFTHAMLGEHVDDKQPPTKKKPFNTILAQPFSHTVCRRTPGRHVTCSR